MDLADIKKTYDVIVSFGANCQTALQLDRHHLRSFSGPLDWFISLPTESLIRLLGSEFKGFMELVNLQIVESIDEKTYVVRDTFSGFLSVHDFPLVIEGENPFAIYAEFREKLYRRIRRFYEKITKDANSVLFIRSYATFDEAKMLEETISKIGVSEFKILIVNFLDIPTIKENEWELEHTCSVDIPKEQWSGSDASWDYLLSNINLSRPYN